MAPASVAPQITDIHRHLVVRLSEAADLPRRLAEPNLPAVREAAELFHHCFVETSEAIAAIAASRDLTARAGFEYRALVHAFDGLLALRDQRFANAATHLLDSWLGAYEAIAAAQRQLLETTMLEVARVIRESFPHADVLDAARRAASEEVERLRSASEDSARDSEWLVTFNLAIEQIVASDLATGRGRVALRSLITHLDLSQDDLGRMFDVAGETVRRWERGQTRIPTAKETAVLAAEASLNRLLELFRPDRLATAVRRPAELFEGDTAYEWILRGRIAEVAERYETALAYQG